MYLSFKIWTIDFRCCTLLQAFFFHLKTPTQAGKYIKSNWIQISFIFLINCEYHEGVLGTVKFYVNL